jgi:hypothetical protein
MVTRVVDLRAGAAPPRVVLPCPDGMRVAGLLPPAGARVGVGYAPGTTIGHSRTARLAFERGGQGAVVVGTLCRRVAPSGSVLPPDARAAAAVPRLWVKVCAPHAYRRTRPGDGAPVAGSVRRAQPLEVRGTRDGWARVRTDAGDRGWIPAAALCRGGVVRPA